VECKRAEPTHKRSVSISQHPENRHPLGVRNPFYETKLCKNSNLYRTHYNHPNGRAHADSAIIIRKDIKHHELAKYEMDHIQATNVSFEDWDGNLTILTIYCPARHTIKKEKCNAFINPLGHRFLVGGDFNAKRQYWSSHLISPKDRDLYQTTQEKQLDIQSMGAPTYNPGLFPDMLEGFSGIHRASLFTEHTSLFPLGLNDANNTTLKW
jgi:hypothetical protein